MRAIQKLIAVFKLKIYFRSKKDFYIFFIFRIQRSLFLNPFRLSAPQNM